MMFERKNKQLRFENVNCGTNHTYFSANKGLSQAGQIVVKSEREILRALRRRCTQWNNMGRLILKNVLP